VLVDGEEETGVTLHRMVKRADAGAIIACEKVAIAAEDTALTLHYKVCESAKQLLMGSLPDILRGSFIAVEQDERKATYVGRRTPEDGRIDWQQPVQRIHNLVRAVTDPWPGAFSYVGAAKFIIWQSKICHNWPAAKPGTVLSVSPFVVACAEGALEVVTGQSESGVYMQGSQLAQTLGLVAGALLHNQPVAAAKRRTRVLILGVNGFNHNFYQIFVQIFKMKYI